MRHGPCARRSSGVSAGPAKKAGRVRDGKYILLVENGARFHGVANMAKVTHGHGDVWAVKWQLKFTL